MDADGGDAVRDICCDCVDTVRMIQCISIVIARRCDPGVAGGDGEDGGEGDAATRISDSDKRLG